MNHHTLDFDEARARHLQFKSQLRSILYGAPIDEKPVLSQYECGVGQWIYGPGLEAYGHLPERQELEKASQEALTENVALLRELQKAKETLEERIREQTIELQRVHNRFELVSQATNDVI